MPYVFSYVSQTKEWVSTYSVNFNKGNGADNNWRTSDGAALEDAVSGSSGFSTNCKEFEGRGFLNGRPPASLGKSK